VFADSKKQWLATIVTREKVGGPPSLPTEIGTGSLEGTDAMTADRLEIRAYRDEDFEELYAIDQSCYPPGIAYSRAVLAMFLYGQGTKTLVASWEGRPVGFVTVQKKRSRRGHIITLDVLESHRRRRIGHTLLQKGEEWLAARGILSVDLETAVNNPGAVEFWKRMGYSVRRRLAHYYTSGVDALLMNKTFMQTRPPRS
jgi:ribosomal-protein-alanine N-acetyltransferase